MQQFDLPLEFIETVHKIWPEDGQAWLDSLPSLLDQCCEIWDLEIEGLLPNLSMNCLVWVFWKPRRRRAVLKLCKEESYELRALRCLNPRYTVELLAHERKIGALLLHWANPGTPLRELHRDNDMKATEVAAQVMAGLSGTTHPDAQFPSLGQIMRINLERGLADTVMSPRIPDALALLEHLESSAPQSVLLHGDLHHDNIVFDQAQGWICIDPKGLIGDPAYEAARLLCNPLGEFGQRPMGAEMMTRRVETISTITGFERERVAAWGLLDCLSLASWSQVTGGEMTSHTLACADLLQSWIRPDLSSS